MKLFIKNSFLFLTISAVLLYAIQYCFDFYYSNYPNTYQKPYWILSQKNNVYNYAILGPSTVINNIDICTIDSITGYKGINLGLSGTGYSESYLVLNNFLSTNKVNTLYINIDESLLDSRKAFSYPFHEYFYLPYLDNDEIKKIFKHNIPYWNYMLYNYLPMYKYFDFNLWYSLFEKKMILLKFGANPFDKSQGTQLLEDGNEKHFRMTKREYCISDIDIYYLKKIIDIATNKGCKIILLKSPEYISMKNYYTDTNMLNKVVTDISKYRIQKISFWDYSSDKICYNLNNFNDYTHLNKNASIVFSKLLGIRIKEENNCLFRINCFE